MLLIEDNRIQYGYFQPKFQHQSITETFNISRPVVGQFRNMQGNLVMLLAIWLFM